MSVKPTIVELILNAPSAGKAMLSAVSAAAQKTLLSLVKGDVGLGNVDNTSDANKPVSTAAQTALDAKADLVGGVVPSAQIPAIAITEYLGSVANQAAMLALTGDRGDWCLRSDTGTTFVLSDDDSTLLASWVELNYPTAPVTSVNGETGAVTLSASDVGAAATSHSHAQSDVTNLTTDLAAKAAAAIMITAGTGLSGGGDLSTNRTIDLENTAVTPGSYTTADITVDAQGRITAAANGSAGGSPGGSSGQVQYNDAGAFGGMTSVVYASGGPHLTVTAQSASYIPVLIVGAASQTASLLKCQTSTGVTAFTVANDGGLVASNSNTQSFFQVFPNGTSSSSLRLYRPSVVGAYFDATANNSSVTLSHSNGVTVSSLQLFPGVGAVFNTNNVGVICGVYGSTSATSLTVKADYNTFRSRSGSTLILVGGDAFSTNYAAGPVYVKTGRGTGSGAGNSIYFQGTLPESSGTTLHSYRDLAELDANTTAGETPLLLLDIDKGTLQRVSIGAADSGGTGFKVLRVPN